MIDMESHLDEQIAFRQEMIERLSHVYNETHKEIQKHKVMLQYYMKQKHGEIAQ